MKKCKGCSRPKNRNDFYKCQGNLDGLFGKCKECVKSAVRANRKARFEQYSAYEKNRYQNNEERRRSLQKTVKKWRAQNPLAYKAQSAVNNAVRDGRLEKQDCLFCEAEENIHAHHNDYESPLDVVWLCAKCHHRMHANFPQNHGHEERV